ncbi:MAG: DUF2304 domain-containing protein [Bacilli bacterium]|nr:DUF2304 domain-containing protein [Bacilli bacterium]
MINRLYITAFVIIVLLLIIIIDLLKKGRIPVKYAIAWCFALVFGCILLAIPNLLSTISKFLGFELPSNMVLTVFILLLFLITIVLTVMIAGQKKKTTLLIQEVSLLKEQLQKQKK